MVQKIHNVSRDTLETFTSMHDVLGVSELKFQHENASIHNSHSTKQWFSEQKCLRF